MEKFKHVTILDSNGCIYLTANNTLMAINLLRSNYSGQEISWCEYKLHIVFTIGNGNNILKLYAFCSKCLLSIDLYKIHTFGVMKINTEYIEQNVKAIRYFYFLYDKKLGKERLLTKIARVGYQINLLDSYFCFVGRLDTRRLTLKEFLNKIGAKSDIKYMLDSMLPEYFIKLKKDRSKYEKKYSFFIKRNK